MFDIEYIAFVGMHVKEYFRRLARPDPLPKAFSVSIAVKSVTRTQNLWHVMGQNRRIRDGLWILGTSGHEQPLVHLQLSRENQKGVCPKRSDPLPDLASPGGVEPVSPA